MSEAHLEANYSMRQSRLVQVIQAANLEAMALNAGPSLTYLTGLHVHLSERPVVGLFTPNHSPVIILPELESGKLSNLTFPVQAFEYGEDPGTWQAIFQEGIQAAQCAGGQVGIEPRRMRVLEMSLLEGADSSINFLAGEVCMAELRMQKDETELANMQTAVNIAQNALEAILPEIKPEMTERELAAEITVGLLREGSDSQMPFSPIVASGPNSANPHAFPSDRQLERGDLLIIDWGANTGGYFSDLTRTFAIGEPQDEMRRIAKIVLEANDAAREIAGPGVAAEDIDRAARQVIEDAGYGEFFIHRTGHGLGMEGHEEPYIRAGNALPLTPGMTFTIEPGIYLPGRGGVRIEDDVVITEHGLLSLSDMPRELRFIGE
jgi:Xaa-Pro dipeptidase